MSQLPPSAQRVQEALRARGFANQVRMLDRPTRTAAEAAALGCDVAQIARSLVFRGLESGGPVLIVRSGANRVDERKVAAVVGEAIGRADAEFVRVTTGSRSAASRRSVTRGPGAQTHPRGARTDP
jgi:prolyl-tRNA editing enzyme YbaK/EbsC (Cys-tRNA(Pro) deacylase)